MAGFFIHLMAWPIFIRLAVSDYLRHDSLQENAIRSENLLKDFNYKELVIPEVYHAGQILTNTLTQEGHVKDITIRFHAFNQDFVLDLLLNSNLFSSVYVEKIIHSSQNQRETHLPVNHTESHCYYHGRLKGALVLSSSSVAVSTCHGIRGQIAAADDVYFIEPVVDGTDVASLSTPHYVFKHSESMHRNTTSCGQSDYNPRTKRASSEDETKREKRSSSDSGRVMEPRDADDMTRYVELYVVNDYSQYAELKYKVDEVIRRTKDIINIVNSIYRALNIYVVLVGVEVWTERNKFEMNTNSETTMNNFLEYRRKHISPFHRNDNAQLIMGQELGSGIVGKAPIMTICTYMTSGGVNADRHTTLGAISTTVAHEMGHNFGLIHDLDSCECEDARCVMSSGGGFGNPTKWSSCSKQQLSDTFHQGMDYCLRNVPPLTYVSPTCGNGFTEEGEDCDCGLEQDCANRCCNASTCRLTTNSTCASGRCCDINTCQPLSAATECRGSHGFCDLPEFCDGLSERCPSDVYMQDGVECQENSLSSFCYNGKCRTHDGQCQMLWGRTGKMSSSLCFDHFNVMGSAHGHCGYNWTSDLFQKCQPNDVLCGMLHCEHRSEKLMFWKEALMLTMPDTYIRINGQRHDCRAAIMDVGLDMPDPGMTFDGVKCGDSQICMSHHCVPVDSVKTKSCPDCHGHGVCNSLGQCHCDLGYGPPYCDRPGLGGSIHSGPAQKYPDSNAGLIAGLCILFFILIPFIVILIVLVYRHYDQLKLILVRRCRQCQSSSIYKKRFQKPDIMDVEMSPSEVTIVQSTPVASAKSPGVRRAVSFRPEDISGPYLQSSTNSTLNLPAGSRAPVSLVHANSCRAAITYDETRKSPPPRPAPPKFLAQKNDAGQPTALSNNSISSHASDHSSVSVDADSHYLLPKHDSRSETHTGALLPSRAAPLPPYACPNKKKQSGVDVSAKKMVVPPLLDSPDAAQPLLEAMKQSAEPSASPYVNVPSSVSKNSEGLASTLSSFGQRPPKNGFSSENQTKSQLKTPSNSSSFSSGKETKPQLKKPSNSNSFSSSTNETKSQMKTPSYSSSFSSKNETNPQVRKTSNFPAASVSKLKSTFENTSPNPNTSSPPPAGGSLSPPGTENSLPFRQVSNGRAVSTRSSLSSADTPSSLSSQTVLPKRPPYSGSLDATGPGPLPKVSPSAVKLHHSASDSVASSSGRIIARPTVAPKPPPTGVRTSFKS